jgi:hypothetical protein
MNGREFAEYIIKYADDEIETSRDRVTRILKLEFPDWTLEQLVEVVDQHETDKFKVDPDVWETLSNHGYWSMEARTHGAQYVRDRFHEYDIVDKVVNGEILEGDDLLFAIKQAEVIAGMVKDKRGMRGIRGLLEDLDKDD